MSVSVPKLQETNENGTFLWFDDSHGLVLTHGGKVRHLVNIQANPFGWEVKVEKKKTYLVPTGPVAQFRSNVHLLLPHLLKKTDVVLCTDDITLYQECVCLYTKWRVYLFEKKEGEVCIGMKSKKRFWG